MNGLSISTHVAAFIALVLNLWLAGDLVETLAGHYARGGFEMLLIVGYAVFVLGIRIPLAFWRRPEEEPPPRDRTD
jgi:hypothetical protein